jgi:hypothetical protein
MDIDLRGFSKINFKMFFSEIGHRFQSNFSDLIMSVFQRAEPLAHIFSPK